MHLEIARAMSQICSSGPCHPERRKGGQGCVEDGADRGISPQQWRLRTAQSHHLSHQVRPGRDTYLTGAISHVLHQTSDRDDRAILCCKLLEGTYGGIHTVAAVGPRLAGEGKSFREVPRKIVGCNSGRSWAIFLR